MTTSLLDVLIVGAGPVGLFCANELTRHGLTCRIIDKKAGLGDKSKALAIHIRSLDLFEDCGFLDEIIKEGLKIEGLIMKSKGKPLIDADFTRLDANRHFLIDLPQDKTECILLEGLQQKGLDVNWNTELMGIEQQASHATATVMKAGNTHETIEASWVIACDGSHSTLRQLLKVAFHGSSYHQTWWLADLFIDWEQPSNKMIAYISDEGPLVCFPIGNKRYRIVMTAPEKFESRNPTMAEIEQVFQRRCSDKALLSNPFWISPFGIAEKQIQHYRLKRTFFAGDAAHIHSPMGGQGLNTGLQDIYNLAWKLAMVHKGLAKEELLNSYHLERYPIAKSVLQKTGLMTRLILIRKPWLIHLRNHFLHFITSFPAIKKLILRDVAELDLSYAKSPIVAILGNKTHFKIGEFLKDFCLTNPLTKEEKRLRHIIQGTEHHLFFFAGLADLPINNILEVALIIEKQYSRLVKTHIVLINENNKAAPPSSVWLDNNQQVHKYFAIKEACALMIRPDKYLCLTQAPLNKDELLLHMEKGYINKAPSAD